RVALFAAGSGTSKRFAPLAVRAGATVIDNSSAFRLDPQVPLVVPEINPETLRGHRGIIANPNCCAIISITPLWPIHRVNRIRRLQLATYQAASGAGAAAMEVLREHSMAITFECSQPITPARVRELLREAPGVKLVDDAERNYFPMPKDASGQDAILVGRIRNDISDPDGRSISLFVAGDQLLK